LENMVNFWKGKKVLVTGNSGFKRVLAVLLVASKGSRGIWILFKNSYRTFLMEVTKDKE